MKKIRDKFKLICFKKKNNIISEYKDIFNQNAKPKPKKFIISRRIAKTSNDLKPGINRFGGRRLIRSEPLRVVSRKSLEMKIQKYLKYRSELSERNNQQARQADPDESDSAKAVPRESVIKKTTQRKFDKLLDSYRAHVKQDTTLKIKYNKRRRDHKVLKSVLLSLIFFEKIKNEEIKKLNEEELLFLFIFMQKSQYIQSIEEDIAWSAESLVYLRERKKVTIDDSKNNQFEKKIYLQISLKEIFQYLHFLYKHEKEALSPSDRKLFYEAKSLLTFENEFYNYFSETFYPFEKDLVAQEYEINLKAEKTDLQKYIKEKIAPSPRLREKVIDYCSYKNFNLNDNIICKRYKTETEGHIDRIFEAFFGAKEKKQVVLNYSDYAKGLNDMTGNIYSFYDLINSFKYFWKQLNYMEYNRFPDDVMEQHLFLGNDDRGKKFKFKIF